MSAGRVSSPVDSARGRARPARRLPARARRAVLTGHVAVSVGLLGEVAAFLAIAVRASGSDDPAFAGAAYELLAMFQLLFGIPLSFLALSSGLMLGLGTKWGVLRYPWVTVKLVLLLSVLLMGALNLGPAVDAARDRDTGAEARVIAGACWDVVALLVATALSVHKPGRARRGGG